MTHHSRVYQHNYLLINRQVRPTRCAVCDKALRAYNKSRLCSICLTQEATLNWNCTRDNEKEETKPSRIK
jgi:hypothetical protein